MTVKRKASSTAKYKAEPFFKKFSLHNRKETPSPSPSPPPPSPKPTERIVTASSPSLLRCSAEGCNKSFRAATQPLVRKALMRHLYRYRKDGSEVPEDAPDSDLTAKQVYDRAHYLAHEAEALSYKTSEEKQAASRAKYKAANKEKVARASRIANYRAQAKKLPEIMEQGMEAVYKWAEEKEQKRVEKLAMEESD